VQKQTLTAARAREALEYDPETGLFKWKVRTRNGTVSPGDKAGHIGQRGYVQIRLDGRQHAAHRLAWLIVSGTEPEGQIDHVNGIKIDNRFCNLRDVSVSENQHNRRSPQANNKSGFLGVSKRGTKWRASIKANGKLVHVGLFDTPEYAHSAYVEAKRRLHSGNTL